MKKTSAVLVTVFLFFSIHGFSQQEKNGHLFRIALHTELIADTSLKMGMGNIFFSSKFDTSKFRFPDNWKNTEIAAIVEKDSILSSVYIARHQDATGSFKYVVDRNGDNSFLDEEELMFRKGSPGLNLADVVLTFTSKTDASAARKIQYQVLTTTEGKYYEYALKKEYSAGVLNSEGISRRIELYTFFRNPCYNSEGKGVTAALDADGNGIINTTDYLDSNTNMPVRNEMIRDLSTPIVLGHTVFQFRALDTEGKWIEFEKMDPVQGFVEGLIIPAKNSSFKSMTKKGETVLLNKAPLTLLILSSTSCAPCERIRPELNKIDEAFREKGLTSLIMLREQSVDEMNDYFSKHAYNAEIVFCDEANWNALNRAIIVPMFYLIDKEGRIVYKSTGAGEQQAKLLRWYISKYLARN